MIENDIEHIIARNLAGESSSDDLIALAKWLEEDEKNQKEFENIKSYWQAELDFDYPNNLNQDFDEILCKIRLRDRKSKSIPRYVKIGLQVAAMLLIGCLTYFVTKQSFSIPESTYTYMTDGSISHFVLPDSSRITLNKNSQLVYNDRKDGTRNVQLLGEAMFDVTKDADRAFVVDMDSNTITVLGTKFSVSNRPTSNILKASLFEGSIKFENKEQNIILSPNKQIIFNKETRELDIEKFDSEIEQAWSQNLIRYKSATFTEFIALLRNHYQLEIVLPRTEIMSKPLTGAIDANLSVEQVLDLMKANVDFKWKKIDNNYIIYN